MPRVGRTVVEYRSYEMPADFPIILLTGDQWRISEVPAKRLHFHNCLEVGYCHSHGGTLVLEKTPVPFCEGDVTCIARNVPHTTYSAPGAESRWSYLFFQPHELLKGFFREQLPEGRAFHSMLHNCHLVLSPKQHPSVSRLVVDIIREMTEKPPNYEVCVRAQCVTLLLYLLRVYDEEGARAHGEYAIAIAPALDYIHEHYMNEFPLNTLADVCHLSPTHFRRLFGEMMGMGPLAFLHQVRILEGCTLLRATELSIAAVSEQVGYVSLSSFNRHFSTIMGCTPSVWRHSMAPVAHPTVLEYSGWLSPERISEKKCLHFPPNG